MDKVKAETKDISAATTFHLCNSCGACSAICPNEAILFKETKGGYFFPEINKKKCISCGLCYCVCPGLSFGKTLKAAIPDKPFIGNISGCFVGKALDKEIYMNGQSGGVITALLKFLFLEEKIDSCIGVEMQKGNPPRASARIIYDPADLVLLQKSKYTPVPVLEAIKSVDSKFKKIAIVGLPCQVHGLLNLIDFKPQIRDRIKYVFGLICDRTMTTTAIDFFSNKASCKSDTYITFRDKRYYSYPGNTVVSTPNGKRKIFKASLRMKMKDFFTPARCYLCFDKLNIYADAVFGDPYGVDEIDSVMGETLVIARNGEILHMLENSISAGFIKLREASIDNVLKGQAVCLKKEKWTKFMKAWGELERKRPEYPFSLIPLDGNVEKEKALLIHALELDKYVSREEIIKSAELWLRRKKRLNIKNFGYRIKNLVTKISKGDNK